MPFSPRGPWPELEIEECLLHGDTYVPVSELSLASRRRARPRRRRGHWGWRLAVVLLLVALGGGAAESCDRWTPSENPMAVDSPSSLRASRERLRTRYSEHLGRPLTDEELTEILTDTAADSDQAP